MQWSRAFNFVCDVVLGTPICALKGIVQKGALYALSVYANIELIIS